ncbi:arabinogalactan protein 41-like [Musa acuminata AAA Group]|uniref:arabinogalactan protein 41-like n=1 Tax=Musa acuminata AAA Group TaxID=214697 RepID=UPI0031D19347
MASSRSWVGLALVAFVAIFLGILLPAAQAQAPAPAPAPAPTSDGTSIDQGVAYALMMVALAVTYLIHAADASSTWGLF